MSTRRIFGLSGVMMVVGALAIGLPGCGGGGGTEKGPSGETKIIPAVNPAPGTVPVEEEYKTPQPKPQ